MPALVRLGNKRKDQDAQVGVTHDIRMRPHIKKLNGSQALVFLALSSRIDRDGWCWPSMELLEEECGLGRDTISRAINRMAKIDIDGLPLLLIVRQQHGGLWGHNKYLLFPDQSDIAMYAKARSRRRMESTGIDTGKVQVSRCMPSPILRYPETTTLRVNHEKKSNQEKKKGPVEDTLQDSYSDDSNLTTTPEFLTQQGNRDGGIDDKGEVIPTQCDGRYPDQSDTITVQPEWPDALPDWFEPIEPEPVQDTITTTPDLGQQRPIVTTTTPVHYPVSAPVKTPPGALIVAFRAACIDAGVLPKVGQTGDTLRELAKIKATADEIKNAVKGITTMTPATTTIWFADLPDAVLLERRTPYRSRPKPAPKYMSQADINAPAPGKFVGC